MMRFIATFILLVTGFTLAVQAQPTIDGFSCETYQASVCYADNNPSQSFISIPPQAPPVDPDPDPVDPDPVDPDPVEPDPDHFLSRWTVGTDDTSDFDIGPVGPQSGHGVRIYCPVSHFSYDDPIVYPDQPGAAHAHMFWGNTSINYATKGADIRAPGSRSTCEGGTNNLSGMWSPVLYNEGGEALVPEEVLVYYKSFTGADQPIPTGLEMLANRTTAGYPTWGRGPIFTERDSTYFYLNISFPECVATNPDGSPVLRYQDYGDGRTVNSHVRYGSCGGTHPYHIPRVTFQIRYPVALAGDNPYLASDRMSLQASSPNMSTLHADYQAGLSQRLNDTILRCTQENRDCEFAGNRGQLPERFFNEDGVQIYRNSVRMQADVDRTPFGRDLPTMRNHQH